jgi:dephospho-CoA kinase
MIFAVTGLCGVGKTEAADHLQELSGGQKLYLGDMILREVDNRGLPRTPENELSIRQEMRDKHGPAAFVIMAVDLINLNVQQRRTTIVDAVFCWDEYLKLKELSSAPIALVSIHVPLDVRCERLASRPSRQMDRKDVQSRDEYELLKLGTSLPMARANFQIVNDGTLEEYRAKLSGIWERVSAMG